MRSGLWNWSNMCRIWITTNDRQEHFVYGLNPKIRAMVQMWKPSSVAEAVENARYVEEHMNLARGARPTFLHRPGFVGKAPRTFRRGGGSRPLPYGNRVVPRTVTAGISMEASVAIKQLVRGRYKAIRTPNRSSVFSHLKIRGRAVW
jgi:hypothetical protein